MVRIGGSRLSRSSLDGNQHHNGKEKEREAESMEVKSKLKVSCTTALWILAIGSLFNSKKIRETKALLVLAKIIEKRMGNFRSIVFWWNPDVVAETAKALGKLVPDDNFNEKEHSEAIVE
ncbi:Hypothetical predicted protein [Olea europaea subsp. europaea]|uniref:Uncharacterized protein n=1 Tax=Olea europaea subsp. europaea TaxID=158383 RepID=A0A8S0Q186_OLEEU|nr:Hypothetical predicted protein [Olea europaea subsp. europaea]